MGRVDDLMVFSSPEFGQIRTVEIGGEPWLVGKDVAKALGYSNTKDALAKHVDPEDKGGSQIATPSGTQEMTVINESGLYSLVLSSKLPGAKRFRRWVTGEVLPSIRKTGLYATEKTVDAILADPDVGIRLLTSLKEERARRQHLESQARENAPKVLFHDAVGASDDTILIRDLAKLLAQNGVPNMGGTRLFSWLRDNGYLCKEGKSRNLPTQRSMEMGLFRVRESVRIQNGDSVTDQTTRVTGKGQQYFIKKFLGGQGMNPAPPLLLPPPKKFAFSRDNR